jgi:hypothetical protein
MTVKRAAFVPAFLFAATATPGWAQSAAGSEFRVNATTAFSQLSAGAATDGSGNFVVVWASYGQDGESLGVFGQRFRAAGARLGLEFQVNSYTTGTQAVPSVASDGNGNFVVVWLSVGQDAGGYGIFGQRFNAAGIRQGGEFRVNTYTTGLHDYPSVATDVNGNFVVVWSGYGPDKSLGVSGQLFDAFGVPQGVEFQINTYTTGGQRAPVVTSEPSGNFVVVWHSEAQDGSAYGLFGQRFAASGARRGGEFQVNSFTTGNQSSPRVASDASGNFVVVWTGQGQDGNNYGVFGRRFDATGAPQGSEFQVNTYTTGLQASPSVTADEDGTFEVVWTTNQDGSYDIFGQRFDAAGVRQGSEFRVNSYTTDYQNRAAIASSPDGDLVVVWESYAQDGSSYGVFGQRYGDIIFEDGFESGDLTRWSAAATNGVDLNVGGSGAMAGTLGGLQAFVNDTNALFVQDDTPSAENRYRARFYFDPNGFDPGESQSHFRMRILIAFDDSGFRVITLVLKRQAGAYSVEGRVRLNDGTRADTGFFPIADGPHFFEVDWIRSAGPGIANGLFTLRIDNVAVSTLVDLDNDSIPVDFVRMGALSIKTGAAGTLFYDQFESRRQRLIGPE